MFDACVRMPFARGLDLRRLPYVVCRWMARGVVGTGGDHEESRAPWP